MILSLAAAKRPSNQNHRKLCFTSSVREITHSPPSVRREKKCRKRKEVDFEEVVGVGGGNLYLLEVRHINDKDGSPMLFTIRGTAGLAQKVDNGFDLLTFYAK